jgi:branched-chain amino acid transport system substrate-binding protein
MSNLARGLLGALALLVSQTALADVKIGFQAPLTGLAATDGKSAKAAAEIAIDDLNAAGGVLGQKLELVTYDDQAKSDQAIFTANKLIGDDGVKFAISGSYSAAGRAAAPIFQKVGVVFISAYGVHPDITKAGDYCFRLVRLGPPQGRAAAFFIADSLKLKKASVISMDNDYGEATLQGFLSDADKYGIRVVNKYNYSLQDRQFGPIVAGVKRDDPEVIYATGYFFTAGPLVAQLRAGGVKATIVGSQAFDSGKFIDIAGAAAEGVYVVDGFDRYRKDPKLEHFTAEFQKRAGYPPEGVAAEVYSSFDILVDAMKRAGSLEPAKVRDALAATKDFPMLNETLIGFNKLHEVIMPASVDVVKDGKFVHFSTIEDKKVLAPPED